MNNTNKTEKPLKWDINKFPSHVQIDVQTRNENIDAGRKLCEHCEGTGNEFYSQPIYFMYHKCPKCDGEGYVE